MAEIQTASNSEGLEYRQYDFDFRESGDGDGLITFRGKATSFRETIKIGNWFQERIDSGAFSEWLDERDNNVFLKVMHEGLPIASRESKTMAVTREDDGIYVRAELDKTDPDVIAVKSKINRGIINKMSVGMRVITEEWEDTQDPKDLPIRTIKKAELREVSIVDMPAYEDTNAEIAKRAKKELNKSVDQDGRKEWLKEQRAKLSRILGVT